jgi:AhpD family alkylhydroperoxidase
VSFIAAPPERRYSWLMRVLFALQRRRYGRELEPTRLWGRLPRAFVPMLLMYRALDRKRSPIEPGLRSLIQVRVSQINWCEFCVDLNAAAGLARGVSEAKFAALGDYAGSPLYDERERAALAYAEAMTHSDRRVDAATVARLRAHFDDDAIVELAALIAYQNMSSKFNAGLGVPAQGFCRVPVAKNH